MDNRAFEDVTSNDEVLWRIEEVCVVTTAKKSQIHKKVKEKAFPASFNLFPGSRTAVWKKSDILAWIAARAKAAETEPRFIPKKKSLDTTNISPVYCTKQKNKQVRTKAGKS